MLLFFYFTKHSQYLIWKICILKSCAKNSMRLVFFIPFFINCNQPNSFENSSSSRNYNYKTINNIELPTGFKRVNYPTASFSNWLQNVALKKDNIVYLYNHQPKPNQHLHSYVLDIEVGNKNLQQCADAIMKLRALYFYSSKQYQLIEFKGSEKTFNFLSFLKQSNSVDTLKQLNNFLEIVFTHCGSYNLNSWLHKKSIENIDVGDVFIEPGSPGHAMIVVDVAININSNERIFLLAQSYMPAQSIHIVKNLNHQKLSPWYSNKAINVLTPSWNFKASQHLKTW